MARTQSQPEVHGTDVRLLAQLRSAGSHPVVREFPEGAIIVFDRDLRYLSAGGHGLATVGLTRQMIEGRTIGEVFPAEVAALLRQPYRQALDGQAVTVEIPFGERSFLHSVSPLADDRGRVIAGIGFAFDVTEARRAARALRKSEERLREQSRRLHDAESIGRSGSWEWDMATDEITWSDGLFAMHELDPHVAGLRYAQAASRVHPDDRAVVDAAMEACRQSEEPVRFRYRVTLARNGELRWFDSHARGVFADGALVRLVGAVADITELVQAQEQLAHDALHDSLTGLPNRALLLDRLDAALIRSGAHGRAACVLFCDLDGFKGINDTAGHAAGDTVLIEVANRLRQVIRQGDTVARVGGDEFVLVIEPWNRPGTTAARDGSTDVDDRKIAIAVADRLVRALNDPVRVGGVDHEISVSVGITFPSYVAAPDGGRPGPAEVLSDADAAMYEAKRHGKNGYRVASTTLALPVV
jgi:diguanylate cyclase (GGDEF)-like protein/PAS domain S-box-containing protein